MRMSFKKVILFAVGFLFMINYSFNAFADILDSASNKFFSSNNINETLRLIYLLQEIILIFKLNL